jgi:G8 domain
MALVPYSTMNRRWYVLLVNAVFGIFLIASTFCCVAVRSVKTDTIMTNNSSLQVSNTMTPTPKRKHAYLRTVDIERREQVQNQVNGIRDFKPLACNAEVLKPKSICTDTWSSRFGTGDTHANLVIIPCGVCVTMNHASGKLNLNGGIDIQGKLVVPDGVQIDITTSYVIVQGELTMASTKPIDGIPNIKITLVGTNDAIFKPIDVNANACNGRETCIAGKKSIVVAGGKVTLNGVPNFAPAWTRLHDVLGGTFNNPDTIVVPASTINKWSIGSQVVITSHTFDWFDHQVRTILGKVNPQIAGFVGWKLNATFVRPTTSVESSDFAVEVALLSRNILFEGSKDATQSRHGGHFMIFHTPSIVQTVNGVEFRNFGQQGLLGRYPIHFHYCNDVTGSIVSKNSIRHSNQRCISVHGTDKLKVQENVAYDTKGHCYLTEDGTEIGNEFVMNIGIQTGPVTVLIPNIASAMNGEESDEEPSTFWITNPSNTWIGNVAAGSQNSGFWFDPLLRGPKASLYPKGYTADSVLLGVFKDNTVHSVGVIRDESNPKNSVSENGKDHPELLPSIVTHAVTPLYFEKI